MAHPKEILQRLDANARKSLSQNFLTSPHWATRLATTALQTDPMPEEIWEIGPGLGAITREIVKRAKVPVRVFEYDRKLSAYLREEFPQIDVVEGDFLKADLESYGKKKVSVVSNLPYHLSSPVLFKLLETDVQWVQWVLTFQREFAQRLIATVGSAAYGGLSVVMQVASRIDSLGVLPPGAFYPAPNVSSESLIFRPKTIARDQLSKISLVVRAAFAHRRKKISRNLQTAFPTIEWKDILLERGYSDNARPEELNKDDYLALAERLPAGQIAPVS
jgi:16S rRNA (adenine1518-N6/adenine1519-N6)-dimethyltransferase